MSAPTWRHADEPSRPELLTLLELAESAARAAGHLLVDGRPADLRVRSKSTPTDPVTEMDTASERLLVRHLLGERPTDGVLGEEGASDAGTSGLRWVLDPIDGTVNYLYDLPFWSVSVAADIAGEAVVGVVHAPLVGQTWTALRGGGAFCNGVPVRCSSVTSLDRALVATGFSYVPANRRVQAQVLGELMPQVRDVRRLGSAALDLCHVGGGRVDAYYERGTHRWDVAAGALVAREAGARVEGLRGQPEGIDMIVAAPPALFDALHAALVETAPDRPVH